LICYAGYSRENAGLFLFFARFVAEAVVFRQVNNMTM